jgi:hypothetical protein
MIEGERNLYDVLIQIIKEIPESKAGLIEELKSIVEDLMWKAPELCVNYWDKVSKILCYHITLPFTEDWEKKVYKLFTTKDYEELIIK